MKHLVIYVHGKGGSPDEAEHYKAIFKGCEVIGFDYKSSTPWEACDEFPGFFDEKRKSCDKLTLIANSIGAFFSISSLSEKQIDEAFFISPVVNMELLIKNMMKWADVTEDELRERREIHTDFGETLTWEYLVYVRLHRVEWNVPTSVLYGEKDNLTSFSAVSEFAEKSGASLTVMAGGEHWFHTEEQMKFLDNWIKQEIKK